MRYFPEEDYEREDLKRLNAAPRMVEVLKLNPSYTSWGPHEDYMLVNGDGWNRPLIYKTWSGMDLVLNDLNEVVNFYFFIHRARIPCETCGKSGYNPETRQIAEDFYDFDNTGRRWVDKITQDEVDALIAHDRLREYNREKKVWEVVPRTAAEVNEANHQTGLGRLQHDGINRHILIETRAKRLGVWGLCPECNGHAEIFTEPAAKLGITLWLIHPRKGASRGVEIQHISQTQLPEVYKFLREAAARNAERFSKIP